MEASIAPDCRSAHNNLYSGIPHVPSVLDLYILLVQYFPRLPVQCFPLLPVQCFSLLPVRISDSDLLVCISNPDLLFAAAIPIPVSRPCSVSRFGFCSVSRSVSHIRFCSMILNCRLTPFPFPVPDSVSVSPSSRQRLPLLLALLPRGVALYRRQCLITDSHAARP